MGANPWLTTKSSQCPICKYECLPQPEQPLDDPAGAATVDIMEPAQPLDDPTGAATVDMIALPLAPVLSPPEEVHVVAVPEERQRQREAVV
ncbi:hypothetical protein BC937DRAFT_88825 [Endogone sp. FLAS-F59071]|nr:hypothetical protein BC937DRAFT_88825 [Endogone sp. FLAS-F59071]|eukprot:RUS18387.1 hypothetical protein BC937DRAFT_88825 [Endogone sp. FLAS-F59071]